MLISPRLAPSAVKFNSQSSEAKTQLKHLLNVITIKFKFYIALRKYRLET